MNSAIRIEIGILLVPALSSAAEASDDGSIIDPTISPIEPDDDPGGRVDLRLPVHPASAVRTRRVYFADHVIGGKVHAGAIMNERAKEWSGEIVRKWLESRLGASLSDQASADKQGRAREDDYDKAAAEEWVCRATRRSGSTDDPKRFAEMLKGLLDQDEYDRPGVHDERRFEREVRSHLRKLIKMTKANTGFENILRYQ